MVPTRQRLTIDSARRMLRHGAYKKVAHILEGMRPGDAAAFFGSVPLGERRRLSKTLGQEARVRLMGALAVDVAAESFAELEDSDIVALLGRIPREDAAAVLRFLDLDRRERILRRL